MKLLHLLLLIILISCSSERHFSKQRIENGNEHTFVYFKTIIAQNDPYKPLIKYRVGDNIENVKIAYFGGQTEVTNGQYWNYISQLEENDTLLFETRKPRTENWNGLSNLYSFADSLGDNYDAPQFHEYPVVNIMPEDALGYVNWLNSIEPDTLVFYRLFNEFEWLEFFNDHKEIDSSFAWGGNYWRNALQYPLANYAEFNQDQIRYDQSKDAIKFENSDSIGYQFSVNGPMPVWSFNPNVWGAYNLSGNVAELTTEYFELNGSWYCKTHGGSWASPVFYLRKAPSEKYVLPSPYVGFRVLKVQIILNE